MRLKGTIDLLTGEITLEGDLTGLTLSETLRRRIPFEARPAAKGLALNSGVVDIELNRFRYDPRLRPGAACDTRRWRRLREGVWECPNLPFPGQRALRRPQCGRWAPDDQASARGLMARRLFAPREPWPCAIPPSRRWIYRSS